MSDHQLTVRAAAYTPAGAGNVPTGEIAPVERTPLDLRSGAVLGDRLGEAFLAGSRGYDHNYVLDRDAALAAELWCPRTGIGLELTTTLPGMQLYTAGFLTERTGQVRRRLRPRPCRVPGASVLSGCGESCQLPLPRPKGGSGVPPDHPVPVLRPVRSRIPSVCVKIEASAPTETAGALALFHEA